MVLEIVPVQKSHSLIRENGEKKELFHRNCAKLNEKKKNQKHLGENKGVEVKAGIS